MSYKTGKVKVQFTLEQVTKAQRGDKRYGYTLSLNSALNGVGGQRHAPALYPREDPVPIV